MYCIIGANGYLGSYVKKAVLQLTDEDVLCVNRHPVDDCSENRVTYFECDMTDKKTVDELIERLKTFDNVKVVYLAAFHNPDQVEKNRQLAWTCNVDALAYFLNNTSFVDKIYYPSTDSVYGESEDFYHFKEDDDLNPVNFYGHNKVVAEALLVRNGRNVVRFPFLISPSLSDKPHFYDRIVESLRNNEPFEMYEDSYRSSLSFDNAAKLMVELIEKDNVCPIVNVCGDKDLSKYDVGIMIAEKEGYDTKLIVPITMAKAVDGFTSKRATSTLMDNSLLKKILNLDYVDIFEEVKRK